MRAKKFVMNASLLRRVTKDSSSSPEAILLQPRPRFALRRIARPSHKTMPGQKSMAMTVGNGSRVYWAERPVEPPQKTLSTGYLDEPMAVLLSRARRLRYENERPDPPTTPATTPSQQQLWVDKHAPSSFAHLLTDERTNREVLRSLRAWDPFVFGRAPPKRPSTSKIVDTPEEDGRPALASRVIVLSGPAGLGKTTLAHFVARHCGYKPLEVNASDDRSADVLKEHILRAMETTLDFSGKAQPNCLILDEVDGAEQALSALLPLIRADSQQKQYLRRPIIFICNNAYAVRSLMPCARHFYVKPPSAGRLVMRLQGILRSEEKPVQAPLLHALVASTAGDVRSCLHTLQFAAASGDLNASLKEMLEGGKDARNHVPGVVQGVFRRDKKGRRTVDGVLNMVEVS